MPSNFPIIKIKRGSGAPKVWGQTNGITAGEFAYDKTNNVLYLGITGGYCGAAAGVIDQTRIPDTQHNVIPVGMQISNDSTFGGPGANINDYLGYSNFTVPTTNAVKNYIAAVKANESAGFTFYAGAGITFVLADPTDPRQGLTFVNTGVLVGFTAHELTGNFVGASKITPGSANDLIEFRAGSGILLGGENSTKRQIQFLNTGVTGINGATGNITSFSPIQSLSGFTTSVGYAVKETLVPQYPIEIGGYSPAGYNIISHGQVFRDSIGSYGGTANNIYSIVKLNVTSEGHIQGAVEIPVNFSQILPTGFTEAVEDVAFTAIAPANNNPSYAGICFEYVDNGSGRGTLFALNTGVRSIGIFGGTGASGEAKLRGATGIGLMWNSLGNRAIDIFNTAPKYTKFEAAKASSFASGAIYGGITGPGTQFTTADVYEDTLKLYAGRGIGISAGSFGTSDGVMFWNSGINLISPLNASGNLIGDSGFSGDLEIQAGTNITFTRPTANKLVIASSGGSSTGSVAHLHADYGINQSNITNQTSESLGVTGNIEFIGRDGIITRQTTSTDNPTTKDGNLYVGLSSKVYLPPSSFQGSADAPHVPASANADIAELVIPYSRVSNPGVQLLDYTYNSIPTYLNRIRTDVIEGGYTAAWQAADPFDATYSNYRLENSNLGNALILIAKPGSLDRITPESNPSDTNQQAEVRLLAWPNPENIGAYLDSVWVGNQDPNASGLDGCASGNCVGYPPNLPICAVYNPDSQTWSGQAKYTGSAVRPTVVANGNIVAKDSIFVNNDIWITGDILDAKTGCLYTTPGSSPQGSGGLCVECLGQGNVGITGSLRVDNNLFVHGACAYFNVDDIAIESRVLKIGGLSGGQQLTGSESNSIKNSDRGIQLFTRMATPPLAVLNAANNSALSSKIAFVGVDTSDGVFRAISDAQIISDANGITYGGLPMSIQVGDVNNVGITASNNGYVYIKGRNNASHSTNMQIFGHFDITTSSTSATKSVISLGNNVAIDFANNTYIRTDNQGTGKIIHFNKAGLTFDVGSGVYTSTAENTAASPTHNLKLIWQNTDATAGQQSKTVNIRNLADQSRTVLVDVGRYIQSANETSVSLETLPNGNLPTSVLEAPLQILYNKQLAEGTIIDCGTY